MSFGTDDTSFLFVCMLIEDEIKVGLAYKIGIIRTTNSNLHQKIKAFCFSLMRHCTIFYFYKI